MKETKPAGNTAVPTQEMSALEKDTLNTNRLLDEERQALIYRYQHHLVTKMVASSEPVDRAGKDLILATPHSDVWRQLSPELMSCTAQVLLLSVSPDYVSASVYDYAGGNPRHLYLTFDHFEVLELIENALEVFQNASQDQFEEYQRTYSAGIRKLASDSKGGQRV